MVTEIRIGEPLGPDLRRRYAQALGHVGLYSEDDNNETLAEAMIGLETGLTRRPKHEGVEPD